MIQFVKREWAMILAAVFFILILIETFSISYLNPIYCLGFVVFAYMVYESKIMYGGPKR